MDRSRMRDRLPGRFAPALIWAAAAALLTAGAPAAAQQGAVQTSQPPASAAPVPGSLELAKMIWSTMAAVDHANRSGNYSVLRDISAQGFQINNDPSRLAEVFAGIRNARI